MAGPAYPNSRNKLTAMSEAAKSGNINMPGEAPKTPEARAAAGNAAGRDWASGDSREAQALRADMQKSGLEANAGAVRQDTGGWSYRDLGDGRIEIVSAPPGSKAAGKILDPSMISKLSDPAARAKAERAYASIKNVMSGGEPLAPYRSPAMKKPQAGGAVPAASAGGAVDTSALRGDPSRVDAPGPGITPPSGVGGFSEPERPGMSPARRVSSPVGKI